MTREQELESELSTAKAQSEQWQSMFFESVTTWLRSYQGERRVTTEGMTDGECVTVRELYRFVAAHGVFEFDLVFDEQGSPTVVKKIQRVGFVINLETGETTPWPGTKPEEPPR